MYKNVGIKIKSLAVSMAIIIALIMFILAIVYFTDGSSSNNYLGWIFIGVAVLSFVMSWPLYGFGELVENVSDLRRMKAEDVRIPTEKKSFEDELPSL